MQGTDPADDVKCLPRSPERSPMRQYRCQSGSLGIVGVLYMDHWTWSNEGFCSQFMINIPAKRTKFALYLYLGLRLIVEML